MMFSLYRMTLCILVNLPKDTVLNSPISFHGLLSSSLVLLYKSGITSAQLCFLLQKIYRTGLGGMPSPVMESPMGSVLLSVIEIAVQKSCENVGGSTGHVHLKIDVPKMENGLFVTST